MKYYKTKLNEIRAIGEKGDIDEDQSHLVQKDWIEITYNEMLAITNPPKTNEELEAERINSIKAKANQLITLKYPDYKQLNIIRVGGEDLITMSNYIDEIRKISNEAEANGTALENINWNI